MLIRPIIKDGDDEILGLTWNSQDIIDILLVFFNSTIYELGDQSMNLNLKLKFVLTSFKYCINTLNTVDMKIGTK